MTLLIIAMPVVAVFAAVVISYAKSASAAREDEIMNMKLREANANLLTRRSPSARDRHRATRNQALLPGVDGGAKLPQ